MCDAGAIGERGRVEFSPAMVVCRASSGADRSWLRSLAAAGPWLRRLAGALPSVSGSSRAGAHQWHSDKDLLRSDKRIPCFGRLPEAGG